MFNGARILVAPLDWGLGHAARCVPIIRALLQHGAEPVIGADGGPLSMLREEFPELEQVVIPGMTVRYGKGDRQLWSMVRQFPAMVRSISTEHALFQRIQAGLALDAVISDQRFGIRSKALPSVLITHQVFPFTPFAQGALRKLNLRNIERFDRCWIMDEPEAPGLAGALSHGTRLSGNAMYIGTHSRFDRLATIQQNGQQVHRIVAVISGPEPQRTILEGLLIGQLRSINGQHMIVCGLPNGPGKRVIDNVTCHSHMDSDQLAAALSGAELIVTRSGYTTLMDLAALERTALLIPTPGQPEQEYLASVHGSTERSLVQRQDELDITAALASRRKATEPLFNNRSEDLERALKDLSQILQ